MRAASTMPTCFFVIFPFLSLKLSLFFAVAYFRQGVPRLGA